MTYIRHDKINKQRAKRIQGREQLGSQKKKIFKKPANAIGFVSYKRSDGFRSSELKMNVTARLDGTKYIDRSHR